KAVGTSIISQALDNYTCSGSFPTLTQDVNCTYSWDTSEMTDGNYFVIAQATDANGTGIDSLDNNILLDNTASVTLTVTSAQTTGNTARITFSATSGGSGIKNYWVSVDEGTTWSNNGLSADYNYTVPGNETLPYTKGIWIKATNNADQNSSVQIVVLKFESGTGDHPYCGNNKCDGEETPNTCPQDCAPICGDGSCTGNETIQTCPQDCSMGCGDGYCAVNENCDNCEEDCGTCYLPPDIPGTIISEEIIDATPTESDIRNMLSENNLEQLMGKALDIRENYDIERKFVVSEAPSGERSTTIVITINNKKNLALTGITLLEIIPKNVAQKASEIETKNEKVVLREDPIIEFIALGKLGNKIAFSYTVNKEILNATDFSDPIVLNQTLQTNITCTQGCDDGNPCTTDKCINEACVSFLVTDGTPCGYAQKCSKGICIAYPTQPYQSKPLILGQAKEVIFTALAAIIVVAVIGQYYTLRKKRKK
ncbi:MAG: hypothetical protein JW772_00265, partial [Candidatus Diapherotrites archaeon]|nr:hypothetical protein [Candidatus Diapherotrites archaeon]